MTHYEYTNIIIQSIMALGTVVLAIGAIIFGVAQNRINKRIQQLQDYVALVVKFDPDRESLKVLNVGKINLYLHKIECAGKVQSLKKGDLIAIGVDAEWGYNIPLHRESLIHDKKYILKMYLIDSGGTKYISENSFYRVKNLDKDIVVVKVHEPKQIDWVV